MAESVCNRLMFLYNIATGSDTLPALRRTSQSRGRYRKGQGPQSYVIIETTRMLPWDGLGSGSPGQGRWAPAIFGTCFPKYCLWTNNKGTNTSLGPVSNLLRISGLFRGSFTYVIRALRSGGRGFRACFCRRADGLSGHPIR